MNEVLKDRFRGADGALDPGLVERIAGADDEDVALIGLLADSGFSDKRDARRVEPRHSSLVAHLRGRSRGRTPPALGVTKTYEAANVCFGWKADVAPTRSFELAGAWKLSELDAAWATS